MIDTMTAINIKDRQRGRIHALKTARLYGPFITEAQIEAWFVFALEKNSVPTDPAKRIIGLLTLRDIFCGHFNRLDQNPNGIRLVNAAIVQIADRIRAVKREIRKQKRRAAYYAVAA